MIKYIENKQDFLKEVEKGTVLVDFFATWCGPCRMLSPILEEIDEENNLDVSIIKVDVDRAKDIAVSHAIKVIPTLVLYKDGKIAKQINGYMAKNKLIEFIEK